MKAYFNLFMLFKHQICLALILNFYRSNEFFFQHHCCQQSVDQRYSTKIQINFEFCEPFSFLVRRLGKHLLCFHNIVEDKPGR